VNAALVVLIDGVGHLGEVPLGAHRPDQLDESRLPFVDHRAIEILKQERLGQHVAQARDGIAADRDVDVGEVLFDQRAERHGGEHLLLQDDGDPNHVRLLRLDRRLHEVIEHVAVDVHLFVLDGLDDFVRSKDLVREIGLHRRHADSGRRVDQGNDGRDLTEYLNGPF